MSRPKNTFRFCDDIHQESDDYKIVAIYQSNDCTNKEFYIGKVVDFESKNPGLRLDVVFGIEGTMELIVSFKKWKASYGRTTI